MSVFKQAAKPDLSPTVSRCNHDDSSAVDSSHYGISGNEQADVLAKEGGARGEQYDNNDSFSKGKTII